ncbi:MAG: aspartate--tRNA(Asn) ligase [Candidatus Altarchaeum sp.]|nr:aspartate--tRNA(Asn) ligase [Candidatus Altarchaeum sp.]
MQISFKDRVWTSQLKNFVSNENKNILIAGWVQETRDLGNLKFIILRDREGTAQICMKKKITSDEILNKVKELTKESVISVNGNLSANPKAPNGYEIFPNELNIISIANVPLPLDPSEKAVKSDVTANIDTRLDNRFLDLRKKDVTAIFKLRNNIINAGRKFLIANKFIEIHSPKIIASASEGGTELFPIAYFDKEAFLAQSPQLYKQMLMAAGFDRVFETATYFRAESHDTTRHLNEITAFDSEMSFIDSENDVMDVIDGLMKAILNAAKNSEEVKILNNEIYLPEKFPRISYDECLQLLNDKNITIEWGRDIDTKCERVLGEIIKDKFGSELFFITKYPLKIKPFYTAPENFNADDKYSRAFDLEYKGVEISSGGQRVHMHNLLAERIKKCNLNPENFKFYLDAFKYGMPPHGGFGLGIERILMQMLDVTVREVILFPRDRHRLTP